MVHSRTNVATSFLRVTWLRVSTWERFPFEFMDVGIATRSEPPG